MVDAFLASPAHTHNNTIDEKRHHRKPDEKNKSVDGSNMRTTQVNAGRILSIQLRARSAKNVAWRLKDLHTGRMETTRTTCTSDRETDSARREIQREEDPERRNRLPQSNRNNPGKSLNSPSCKNPSIHMTNQQDKPRLWNGKIVQKLKKNHHQPNQTNPSKLSNFFSCNIFKVHMINRSYKPRPRNGKGVQQLEKDDLKVNQTNPRKPSTPFSRKNLLILMNNVPSVNNKHTNQKNHNRSSHCWNSHLNKHNRKKKASLIKPFEWKIIELKTYRQWSKRILALNQHKNHEPIISRKLEIRNNQPQDFSWGTTSHTRASQDQHAATHNLAPKNYEEQERPRITPSAHHARF